MKKIAASFIFILLFSLILSSCNAITGIFKAGMGVGVFITIAVVVVIVVLIMRSRKK